MYCPCHQNGQHGPFQLCSSHVGWSIFWLILVPVDAFEVCTLDLTTVDLVKHITGDYNVMSLL